MSPTLIGASLVAIGFGLGPAEAFVGRAASPDPLGLMSEITPVAMCAYDSCRRARYIPGPPSVCYRRDMRYCGSSDDYDRRSDFRSRRADDDDDDDNGRRVRRRGPGFSLELR